MTASDTIGQQSPPSPQAAAPEAPAMANPAPWSTTAFGTTAFMLSMYQTGLLNSAGVLIVVPAALFLGGLVLIISSVLQFSRGDVFDGAVAGTFGPFWLIYGAFQTLYAARVPAAQLGSATSLLLAVFAVVTLYLAIASLRTDLVTAAILWLAFAGLVLLSIGAGASIGNVTKAGGAATLAFAILAWYHAAGDIIEFTFGRKLLPFGPPPLR
jgi:uncharacterized protein